MYSASRAATAAYRPILDELGLTYPQYLVMLVLWEDEPRSVRELGEELGLDSGTLSPLLKRLESLGLVERRRSAEDERRVEVFLTDAGTALSTRAGRASRSGWPTPPGSRPPNSNSSARPSAGSPPPCTPPADARLQRSPPPTSKSRQARRLAGSLRRLRRLPANSPPATRFFPTDWISHEDSLHS